LYSTEGVIRGGFITGGGGRIYAAQPIVDGALVGVGFIPSASSAHDLYELAQVEKTMFAAARD
jgi:hypothetical protein